MRNIAILILSSALVAGMSMAEPVVELDDLTGDYSLGDNPRGAAPLSRTMTLVFPDSIAAIDGLRLTIRGSWTLGQRETCRIFGDRTYCDTLPCGTHLALRLTDLSGRGCEFTARTPAVNHVFGDESLVGSCESGTMDINGLLGTVVHAELFCDVPRPDIPSFVGATYGTILSVHLELLGAVPVAGRSWGSTKMMFR